MAHRLAQRLVNYGDRDFELYLRRPFATSTGCSSAAIGNAQALSLRGDLKLFLDHVLQADQGCDFDFLRQA